MDSRKRKIILIDIVIGILIVASCVITYFIVQSSHDKKREEKLDMESVIFTKDTLPRIDASLATQPLTDAFIQNFTGEKIKIDYTNTHPSYVKLINNQVDLIVVTEPSNEELALAKEKGVELEVTKVVNEGFVFFVNKNNKVDDITLDNIQKIYTGQIVNWKDVGGDNNKIIAYQRPVNSGSQTGLLSLVMKGKQVKIPTTMEKIETMEGIIDVVSDYDNGLNSIGYSYYYYANVMYKNDNLKYLAINGVKPEYKTIQDGTYPILTAYFIVTRKGEQNENVIKLKETMLSKRGQEVAKKAGYVPIVK